MSKYSCEVDPTVTPAYYSDGIPVFTPTMAQFADFYRYNKSINRFGMESGIVKVIPPAQWLSELDGIYTEENLAGVKIKNPIVQQINSAGNGVFRTQNIERPRSYNLFQWKELSEKTNYQPPAPRKRSTQAERSSGGVAIITSEKLDGHMRESSNVQQVKTDQPPPVSEQAAAQADNKGSVQHCENHLQRTTCIINNVEVPAKFPGPADPRHEVIPDPATSFSIDRCAELEKTYWRTLTYAEPMYGADMLGSLFPAKITSWNVSKLPNILDMMDAKLPGVNDAYLYAGLWKATFAWHLEDQDLYSINYLHFGAPKQWYSIPQEESDKFFSLMKETFPEEYNNCSEFLRHKTFSVSPQFLEKNRVRFNKIVHNEGEFIITYPYGYHAGFNYGFNLAESVNFALDDWFPVGEKTRKCECVSDSVGINVRQLICRYRGEDYSAPVYPLQEVRVGLQAEAARPAGPAEPAKKRRKSSVKKVTLPVPAYQNVGIRYPCDLCSNAFAHPPSRAFELLETEFHDKKVHRLCSRMFPQLMEQCNKVIGLKDIPKSQRKLKCMVCKGGHRKQIEKSGDVGACFQCTYPKCTRAYHGTCALGDGVHFDFSKGEFLCKFHRKKSRENKAEHVKQSGANSSCDSSSLTSELENIPVGGWVQFTLRGTHLAGLVQSNNFSEHTFTVLVYPSLKEKFEASYEAVLAGTPHAIEEMLVRNATHTAENTNRAMKYTPNSTREAKQARAEAESFSPKLVKQNGDAHPEQQLTFTRKKHSIHFITSPVVSSPLGEFQHKRLKVPIDG